MSGRFLSPNLEPGEGVGCLRPLSPVLTPLPPPQPWQGCSHLLLQPKWREAAGASAPAVLDSHPSGLTVSASHPPHSLTLGPWVDTGFWQDQPHLLSSLSGAPVARLHSPWSQKKEEGCLLIPPRENPTLSLHVESRPSTNDHFPQHHAPNGSGLPGQPYASLCQLLSLSTCVTPAAPQTILLSIHSLISTVTSGFHAPPKVSVKAGVSAGDSSGRVCRTSELLCDSGHISRTCGTYTCRRTVNCNI